MNSPGMKKLRLFVSLIAFISIIPAHAQQIKLGQSVHRQEIILQSKESSMQPMTLVALFHYDISTKELTLSITPKTGAYDRLWVPMIGYDKASLKKATKKMGAKFGMEKTFMHQVSFELQPAFLCSNCTPVDMSSSDFSHEFHDAENPVNCHFRVVDPMQPVVISIRTAVPVRIVETVWGKMKYRYQYVADNVQLTISVPSDPCLLPQNLALKEEVKLLYDELTDEDGTLRETIGREDKVGCTKCKERIANQYANQYREVVNRQNGMTVKCGEVEQYLNEIQDMLLFAEQAQCKSKQSHIVPVKENIAKNINKEASTLQTYVNAIRRGRDVESYRRKGNELMARVDTMIGSLTATDLSSNDVKTAVETYKLAKSAFMLNTK